MRTIENGTEALACDARANCNDAQIRQAALEAIQWLTTINPEAVEITVHEGCIGLEGALSSWHEKNSVEEAVRHLRGVRSVTNQLMVTPDDS